MAVKYFWTDELDQRLRTLNAEGLTMPKIAAELGMSYNAVQKRMADLHIQPAFAKRVHQMVRGGAPLSRPVCSERKAEVTRQMDVRRGFSVPSNLQSKYFELLKGGLAIADARQRLGL